MTQKVRKLIATEIAQELGIYYQTVNKRMKSRYAEKRWGVEIQQLPDGSIRRVVPEDKLHLWIKNFSYRGRPVFN